MGYTVYMKINKDLSESCIKENIKKMVKYCCRDDEDRKASELRWLQNRDNHVIYSEYAYYECDSSLTATSEFLLARDFDELPSPRMEFDIEFGVDTLGTIK